MHTRLKSPSLEAPHVDRLRELDQPVAISARVADSQRQSRGWEDWLPGDYHLPFGRAEARAEAAKWIWQP